MSVDTDIDRNLYIERNTDIQIERGVGEREIFLLVASLSKCL